MEKCIKTVDYDGKVAASYMQDSLKNIFQITWLGYAGAANMSKHVQGSNIYTVSYPLAFYLHYPSYCFKLAVVKALQL